MDEGTQLFGQTNFHHLCEIDNLTMSLCNHSATDHGVNTSGITKEIVVGSQFNNAMMASHSDKVIVLWHYWCEWQRGCDESATYSE